jgi:choline dehydrogenase-like flavoprotein
MTAAYDAVIVGSGPGGSVTGRALARAGQRVLLVEEGAWVEPGAYEPYSLAQMHAQYRGAGLTAGLGWPSVAYTEACSAGGGSEVNSGLYHRPPPKLLAEWTARRRVADLDESRLEPLSRAIERELSVAPWPLADLPGPATILRRGAERLGWHGFDVPRWARYDVAAGEVQVERQTMTKTYLRAALEAGADLWTGTRALRLERRGSRIEAVALAHPAGDRRVVADRFFVCGGAVQTPALLQRSGIWRNVGGGLSVHPTVKVVAEFDEEVNAGEDLATYQVKEFGSWLSFGGSASRKSLIALALAENWTDFGAAVERWRHQVVYYAATRSRGRGRVVAVPGLRDPLVTYTVTSRDLAWLRTGMARLIHLVLAAGAHRVYPSYRGAPVVTGAADAIDAVAAMTRARASLMTVHLCGTVPMGEDHRSGADSYGRVRGLANLWVNDASLLPDAPGVNPQGTIMAIAQRNVDHLLSS